MIRDVSAESPLPAWAAATETILATPGRRLFGLTVRIKRPTDFSEGELTLADELMGQPRGTARHVANTIMPASVSDSPEWRSRADRVIGNLPKRGSYFRRLIAYEETEGRRIHDQLTKTIDALRRPGVVDPGPMVLEKPSREGASHRGFPCLSIVQFHRAKDTLVTTAMYRSHYYDDKAFGNFVGLGRLVGLVSRETQLIPGELLVISTDARVDQGTATRKALNRVKDYLGQDRAA